MASGALKFLLELEDKFSSPANKAISSAAKLGETLGEIGGVLGPLVAVTAAVGALGVAALGAGAALAIHASEAKNDTLDMLDAMLGSQEAAQDVYDRINDMGDYIAITQERGSELARELSAAGLTNKELLLDSIAAIGQVSSVLGEGAGSKIQNLIEKSQAGGTFKVTAKSLTGTGVTEDLLTKQLSENLGKSNEVIKAQLKAGKISATDGIAALTKVLDTKFGATAEKQVLDVGSQLERLKSNITKLFEDVDTGPFLDSFHQIVMLFDQSTESGKTFKFLITSVFDGLFKVVAKVAPYVMVFLKGLAIIGLKAYIALKPLIKTISDAFGGSNQSSLETFAGFMSGVGTAVAFVITQVTPLIQIMGKAIGIFVEIESYLVSLAVSFFNAGVNIIGGLIDGVKSGAGRAVAAVQNVGQSMLDKFTGFFSVHSDSKVMAKMGGHLMGGLETGIADNDTGPAKAMTSAVSPVVAGGKGGGGSTSVTFGPGSIVITVSGSNGADVAAQLREVLPGELAAAFESIGITAGAA